VKEKKTDIILTVLPDRAGFWRH